MTLEWITAPHHGVELFYNSSRPVQPIITTKAERLNSILTSIHPDDVAMWASNDSGNDDVSVEGSEDGSCSVELNRVSVILDDERTQFGRVVEQEKVHRPLNDDEVTIAEVSEAGLDSTTYMETPTLEFENASTWAGVAIASPWMLHTTFLNLPTMSQ